MTGQYGRTFLAAVERARQATGADVPAATRQGEIIDLAIQGLTVPQMRALWVAHYSGQPLPRGRSRADVAAALRTAALAGLNETTGEQDMSKDPAAECCGQCARPPMSAAELGAARTRSYGRDYDESDDGYSDMEAEEKRGWKVIPSWGADGWNLGTWPYVMIYQRNPDRSSWELMSIVEGDRDVYTFATEADRTAAIDYLFLWYAAGERWAPLEPSDRAALDAGTLQVEDRFRGPCKL